MENNLWPADILNNRVSLPKTILLEQANYLSEMSKNIIVGEVKSLPLLDLSKFTGTQSSTRRQISHEFVLRAPSVGNYSFTLFNISHDLVHVYPVSLQYEFTSYNLQNQEELKDKLRDIFNHAKTREIISYLISQS